MRRRQLFREMWTFRHFYLFTSPYFILYAVFGLYPMLFSLYLSFVKWDALTPMTPVGFQNFVTLFQDSSFYTSLWNTLVIGILHIPIMFVLAFLFALLLNESTMRLRGLFRSAVFMPCVTPMVVIAIVFGLLYGQESGLLNWLIRQAAGGVGAEVQGIRWLESERWSKVSISILLIWRWTGYNMILMLAGLQGIPSDCYEAADIDGATRWQKVRHITIPLMRPTFVFCGIMSLIGTVYMFDEVFVLTAGGPGDSSTNFGVYLFNQAFTDFRFGYASAAAYVVAAVVFVLSLKILGQKGGES